MYWTADETTHSYSFHSRRSNDRGVLEKTDAGVGLAACLLSQWSGLTSSSGNVAAYLFKPGPASRAQQAAQPLSEDKARVPWLVCSVTLFPARVCTHRRSEGPR